MAAQAGHCEVETLGPLLTGRAGFAVSPTPTGSQVVGFEDVAVRHLTRLLGPIVARLSALGLRAGIGRLARRLR